LKCFITAYGRNKAALVSQENINNVVRIQTDGIVFKNKAINIKKFDLLTKDEKTTGLIEWFHVNNNNKMVERRMNK